MLEIFFLTDSSLCVFLFWPSLSILQMSFKKLNYFKKNNNNNNKILCCSCLAWKLNITGVHRFSANWLLLEEWFSFFKINIFTRFTLTWGYCYKKYRWRYYCSVCLCQKRQKPTQRNLAFFAQHMLHKRNHQIPQIEAWLHQKQVQYKLCCNEREMPKSSILWFCRPY